MTLLSRPSTRASTCSLLTAKRGAYFALVAIPIINRFDATLDMIDRKLGHVRRNAEHA